MAKKEVRGRLFACDVEITPVGKAITEHYCVDGTWHINRIIRYGGQTIEVSEPTPCDGSCKTLTLLGEAAAEKIIAINSQTVN